MIASSLALQQAIYATLITYPQLLAVLGAPRVYDDTPQPVAFPCVSFGPSTLREASTATEAGDEHLITLHVWSRGRGRKDAQTIAAVLRAALHDQPLALTDHHLVNLRHETTDIRRDPDGETLHATLRLRAVTEPA